MPYGVSNSFKRGTIKTYSRPNARVARDEDTENLRERVCLDLSGPAKENAYGSKYNQAVTQCDMADCIRPDDLSSSDILTSSPGSMQHALLRSDPLSSRKSSELSTPPSSPPQYLNGIPQPMRKPTFSFLKRKRSPSDGKERGLPLSEITSNVQRKSAPRAVKKAKTQMQIDLGSDIRRSCKLCGMEYVPSVREDSILHQEYCDSNIEGVDMGKTFVKDEMLKRPLSPSNPTMGRSQIFVVSGKCSTASKAKAKRVLDVVNAELSAADISDQSLWESLKGLETVQTRSSNKGCLSDSRDQQERYKIFLCLIEDRCVGLCLAEKISKAFPVAASYPQRAHGMKASVITSSSITVSKVAELALIGISRIWVSKAFRQNGIARALLRCVQDHFFYGVQIPKNLMAFSQPTESGAHLAEKWFEAERGWHVYKGNQ